MEKLECLPSIARLSERVLRVLGQNPGKFTLQGTNTYLLGRRNPFILVDTGEGKDKYISYLSDALKETNFDPSFPLVSDIILTHRHHDHTQGLPSVLTLLQQLWGDRMGFQPPRIHKYPLPRGSSDANLQMMLDNLPSDLFVPESSTGGPVQNLRNLQILHGNDTTVQILHTPGHTSDSICIHLLEEKSLFTADTVLGQGTAVFEDLGTYISSLHSILHRRNHQEGQFIKLYPGHGPVVEDGPKLIDSYIRHRMERENQIVTVLSSPPPSGDTWTLGTLVANIYAQYPQDLWASAARGIHLHLLKLEREGKVNNLGGELQDTTWQLTSRL